jgi:hypothetical protein
MIKSLIFAAGLFLYFLVTDLLFVPLRRVSNYNLILLLLFLLIFFIVIYKALTAGSQVKRVICGAFCGLILWSVIGELCPSLRVHPSSILNPICTVDIKQPSAAIYVVILFITLAISYLTGGIKDGLAMMLMVFGSTWSFELYMQNYSTHLPLEVLPKIAYTLGGVSAVIFLLALVMTAKSVSPAGKTFWGYWVYFGLVTTLTSFLILSRPMPLGF